MREEQNRKWDRMNEWDRIDEDGMDGTGMDGIDEDGMDRTGMEGMDGDGCCWPSHLASEEVGEEGQRWRRGRGRRRWRRPRMERRMEGAEAGPVPRGSAKVVCVSSGLRRFSPNWAG